MADNWLTTFEVPTPQAGFDLAIKLSRMAVKFTQPDCPASAFDRQIYVAPKNSWWLCMQCAANSPK